MKSCFFATTLAFCLTLAGFGLGSASAQSAIPLQAVANQYPAADLQAINQRLQQQDEELRQLREKLGILQSEARPLSPVPSNSPQAPQGNLVQTGAVAPSGTSLGVAPVAASNPLVFELKDRVVSLENRLDEQATPQKKQSDDAAKGYEVGSDLKMSATWKNGVQIQTANKDFRLHLGGITQFDITAFDNDPALNVAPAAGGIGPQPDSLDLRRARLRADGVMYEVFEFGVMYDFANFVSVPTPNVQAPASTNPSFNEIFITWTQLPYLGNFKVGNFKEPIGFEHMESDTFLPFMERSYLQDFVFGPFNGGYTPGMDFYNWREDQRGTWAIGWFGNNSDNFGYSLGNDYALTGRLTWCPVYDEPSDGRYVMHFGVAGSTRGADENIDRLRVRGDIRSGPPGVLNPVYADTGNIGSSIQNIAAGEVAMVLGSFSVVGEYVGTWLEDATQPITPVPVSRGTPFFQGGYIQCGYFLTGEHEVYDRHRGTFDRVTPYENAFCVHGCNGECKGWGAWQVLARYNTIDLNDNGINGGNLNSFTFGVNWFWNANARMMLNYDITRRSAVTRVVGGVPNTVEPGTIGALGIRFSYDF